MLPLLTIAGLVLWGGIIILGVLLILLVVLVLMGDAYANRPTTRNAPRYREDY